MASRRGAVVVQGLGGDRCAELDQLAGDPFGDWSVLHLAQRPGPDAAMAERGPGRGPVLVLEFLGHVRTLTASTGPNRGKPLSDLRVNDIATNVEQFYMFMHDHRESAARALKEPGWPPARPAARKLWRRGETQRTTVNPERREVIDNTAFSQIMANLHLIGAPIEEGGFADEQPCASSCWWPGPGGVSARSACSIASRCCRWTGSPSPLTTMVTDSSPSSATSRRRSTERIERSPIRSALPVRPKAVR
jgi:hypothetical protein